MEAEHLSYVNGLMGRLHALDRLIAELRAYRRRGDGYDTITLQLQVRRDYNPLSEVRTAGMINLLLEQRRLMVMELEGLGLTGVPTPP